MNDNNRRPPSQGSTGRSNSGWGTSDPGRGQESGDRGFDGGGGFGGRGSGGRGSGGFGGRGPGRFGGFGNWRPGRGQSGGFPLGLPNLFIIFAVFAVLFGAFASCRPSSGPGQVAGQVKALNADRTVSTLTGAQVILRGGSNTYTTVSTEVPEGAEGTDAYNYRFENVPPGRYTMAVTPPPGSGLQPEGEITLEVKADETFPQSVMLLAEGVQKPRPLSPSEMNPGEVGYVNERGERVVYQQGSGFGLDDALLMYLLFRNPPGFGYGAPPIIYSPPRSSPGSGYRWDAPPSRTSTGSRVTTRPPSIPGQGSTRPSSGAATGPGPTYRSDDSPASARPPASGTGSSGTTTSPANRPSQGVTRPSSSTSPSRSTAPSSSRSSGGSRSGGGRR